ncbi:MULTISPECIES: hypothetical protein [unclassified Chryseobacterium]|uniref:hypothetical protein n=1 Tax=unclassified Chryseobacterium TaxID=2593645 RepID=UPI001E48625B|nr:MULTISPECIES: hypothetical protein [unclassified Chryseobacterium]
MTTLNIVDYMLPVEECRAAANEWKSCFSDFSKLQSLIPTNYVFNISREHLEWMKGFSNYKDFCSAIGVYKGRLIMILYPMNEKGDKVDVKEYPYSFLTELDHDLRLQEIQEYTVVKNAVLSKSLEKTEKDSNMAFPVSSTPILEQDVAVNAIERWRNEGMDWFYKECRENAGNGIFRKFYVPTADLCLDNQGLAGITCSFGLKYNDIYGKMLVTLIFISFLENLKDAENGVQTISNTYDWAKPCPPICRIPDVDVGCEF